MTSHCDGFEWSLDARFGIFSYLLCQAAFFPGWRLVCSTWRVHGRHNKDFCQICALSRVTSRFSKDPLSVTEEQRSIRAENTSQGRLSESFCNVVEGIEEVSSERSCGSGSLNFPDSPPDQDRGNVSYQSE